MIHDPADASWVGLLCRTCSEERLRTLAESDLIAGGIELTELKKQERRGGRKQRKELNERLMFADNHLSCTFKLCSVLQDQLPPATIRQVFQAGLSISRTLYADYCGLSKEETEERATGLMRFLCSINPAIDKLMWLIEPESAN
jgi:hypothetical protein